MTAGLRRIIMLNDDTVAILPLENFTPAGVQFDNAAHLGLADFPVIHAPNSNLSCSRE